MSNYNDQQQPPPGQGHYHPNQYAPRSAGYNPADYPPTPQSGYHNYAQPSAYPSYSAPPQSEFDNPPQAGYAPPEASQHGGSAQPGDFNALAPYNEEKAYAEYNRAYDDRTPPARSDYGRGRDDRDRRHEDRRGYDDRERPDDDKHYPGEPSRYDDRDRDRRNKREDRTKPLGKLDRILGEGKDGERGLGATLIGGAGGAFLGHEMVGKGALGTIGGAIAGALGANAIEHHEDKKKHRRREEQHHHHRRREDDGESYEPRRDEYSRDDNYAGSTAGAMYQQGRQYEQGRRHGRHEVRKQRSRKGADSSSESWSSDD